jgi:hypothetical protein
MRSNGHERSGRRRWPEVHTARIYETRCGPSSRKVATSNSDAKALRPLTKRYCVEVVQLGLSQQIDTTPKSTVETALTEPLGATIRCEQPSHRSRLLGAIADSGSGMPLPGLKAHLSTLAVGSLVFAFHPSPIASAVPAEDGVKKFCRNMSSDAVDVHPWDEYGMFAAKPTSRQTRFSAEENATRTITVSYMEECGMQPLQNDVSELS